MEILYGRPARSSLISRALSRAVVIFSFALLIVAIGVVGFQIIEGWSFSEALYMTVITITTVGFS